MAPVYGKNLDIKNLEVIKIAICVSKTKRIFLSKCFSMTAAKMNVEKR